ncbi:MAG TPA: pitrilysin family protein, partial [Longimicrobiales bacterium]|nr:pitrilysin family protein [Longimicrobiales bacterium]
MMGGRGSRTASPSVFTVSPVEVVGDADVRSTVLPNGLRVLTERVPGVRSVAAGVWVVQGVAHETPEVMGVSHMLEHMVFKGTRARSAREIALSLEALGGSLDAYTSREHTSFQARVLDQHLPEALDVLADLTLHPLLRPGDLELEREVVLEEISTVEDTPDDLVFDLHGEALWGAHPYGHPILGTRETVSNLSAGDLEAVHREAYCARNMVVAVVGSLDHDATLDEVARLFGPLGAGQAALPVPEPAEAGQGRRRVVRDSAQSHIVFGGGGLTQGDPRRYAMVLLSQAFGGGMSSRLFQRIREELALAYAVYSYHAFYRSGGSVGVYLGTRPEMEEPAVAAVMEEMDRLAREALPADELEMVRE